MAQKSLLLNALHDTYAEVQRFGDQLDKNERSISGTEENWGPRDVLVHIGEWQRRFAERLTRPRDEQPAEGNDDDVTNAEIFHLYSQRPWAEIRALVEEGGQTMIQQVVSLSEETLNDSTAFVWQNQRPLWQDIASTGFQHPLVHLVSAYIQRSDSANTSRLIELLDRHTRVLDSTPQWLATAIYNNGCFFALMGQREKALNAVSEAMKLNPSLAYWAPRDTDLVSLHGDQDFQDLIRQVKSTGLEDKNLT